MSTALDAALNYVDRGWRVLRLKLRTKGPTQKGWPELALSDKAAVRDAFNGSPCNVGVLLGNGLCDVDLDCPEALAVAGFFLPETPMMFGRASKRMSHHIYMSDVAAHIPKAVQAYDDPETPGPHMIELRIGAKAAQTVFPPSVHPSGETVAFEPGFDKDPAEIDGTVLISGVEEAAAAALIARAYPREGGHKPAQVLGGFLARAGWPVSRVVLFAQAVMAHVGGPHAKDHIRTARNAAEAHERGENTFGFPQLTEVFGEKRAAAVAKWLHYSETTKAGNTRATATQSKTTADRDNDAHESLIAELAALPPLRYGRERISAAKKIGITAGALDKLVNEQRKANDTDRAQPAHWNVEPWPEPVDGAALLDGVADIFSRYAVLPQHAPVALALWVVHAWALDCFQCSPFVTLVSPTKRCGKSRVLAILKYLTPRSEMAGSISPAALFRYIQQERPTLLMDEADRTVAGHDELQGILNSSHKRVGAYVIRCEGDDHQPRRFSTWGPKAIATIAKLADTLRDRSIIIQMRRKTAQEQIEPWNEDDTEELAALRRRLLRWTEDQAKVLKSAFPDVPAGLDDRAADNWRPLLAIADAAGGSWPGRARAAALGLSGRLEDDDDPLIRILADIRAIFGEMPSVDWIGSAPLAERLASRDGSLWQEWKRGRSITPAGVARLLRRAGIHPTRHASSNRYLRAHFADAWTRYLPGEG